MGLFNFHIVKNYPGVSTLEYNGPFPTYLVPLSSRKTFLMKILKFDLYGNEPVGRRHFRTKPRFDTEAKGGTSLLQCLTQVKTCNVHDPVNGHRVIPRGAGKTESVHFGPLLTPEWTSLGQ